MTDKEWVQSTNTEEGAFQQDPRYKQTSKEALVGVGILVLNILWWYVFAYGLGSRPPEEYTYVLGFPAWFFYSCIVGYIVFSIIVYFAVKYLFKDMALDTEGA